MKKAGTVYKGTAKPKADVTIILSDDTFAQLAEGKLDGQKAFMTGKLKTKGNMMLATKLDGVLKVCLTFVLFCWVWRGFVAEVLTNCLAPTGGEVEGEALICRCILIPRVFSVVCILIFSYSQL